MTCWTGSIDRWLTRQGAGRVLCDQALLDARERECAAITLWTLKANESARRFYERLGYAPDGAERSSARLTGFPLHEMRYRKTL